MGYYTDFKLTITEPIIGDEVCPESKVYKEIEKAFLKVFLGKDSEEDTNEYTYFDELVQYSCNWKWYDWEKDMKALAKLFPDIYFTLEGEGEDREDWWIAEFFGNRSCVRRAEILPPDRTTRVWEED